MPDLNILERSPPPLIKVIPPLLQDQQAFEINSLSTDKEEWLEVSPLPTQDELPCDDGIPMETARHKKQMEILTNTLNPWFEQQQIQAFAGGNMFLYYSLKQVRNQDFKGPDVFVVLNTQTESQKERKSWVIWEEKKPPDIVIELLSESTASEDKNNKKKIYQNQIQVPEYYWFDPFEPSDFAGFELRHGTYQPLPFDVQSRLISPRLGLALARRQGTYENIETTWLRWETKQGTLLTTSSERAELEAEARYAAEQRANSEAEARYVAEQRANSEAEARYAAEVEIANLKALLAKKG